MPTDPSDDEFLAWRASLHRLTDSRDAARSWRKRRYAFAHRLGEALAGPTPDSPAIDGPVVYGIWLRMGLLYVGQTTEAQRRLRDLPVGESHHLANTFPPEIWHKVLVVAWPRLPEAAPLTEALGPKLVGLALEHRLQERPHPLANSERRTPDGGWREVVRTSSTSRGARAAKQVEVLSRAVERVWDEADGGGPLSPACRLVLPERCS
ncbi:hypothetical protein AB0J74_05520 [Asanoa sp. NPDC049573]|uniref:hypothetical protein n=1 Tax=Asanoa sp. NPDC049573 TaxID=3155396 RepID=UPI00341421FA